MKLRTIVLILIIAALGFVVYNGVKDSNKSIELLTHTGIEDVKNNSLQLQAKIKVIKEQSVVKDDDKLLKGEQLEDTEEDNVKAVMDDLIKKEIISEDEKKFKHYYHWDKEVLQEVMPDVNFAGNESIVINYDTLEIIFPNGIQLEKDGEVVYKFSDMK